MKRSTIVMLAALMGLVIAPSAMAWVYGETVVYREPVVVERVYAPPVYSYETTSISVPYVSVGVTRTYVDPAPVYVAPAPVISVGIGPFWGPRYYGHSYWGRPYGHGGPYYGHGGRYYGHGGGGGHGGGRGGRH